MSNSVLSFPTSFEAAINSKTNKIDSKIKIPKKNNISNLTNKSIFDIFLDSEFLKKITHSVTDWKNTMAVDWSKENLVKLIKDDVKYIKYGKYFRLYKSSENKNTLVFDITRNLDDFKIGSKKSILEDKIAKGLFDLLEELKNPEFKKIIGKFRYIELTSWIFGSKNLSKDGKPKLRDIFIENLSNKIPEIDLNKTTATEMTMVDKILTMGVYPNSLIKIRKHKSKGQVIIDLDLHK